MRGFCRVGNITADGKLPINKPTHKKIKIKGMLARFDIKLVKILNDKTSENSKIGTLIKSMLISASFSSLS